MNLARDTLKWARNVHIYVSLIGFLMFLFFAVTGILLNHDSFGFDVPRTSESQAVVPVAVLQKAEQDAVISNLRAAAGITQPLSQYNAQADDIEVTFAGPGKRTQALIDRKTGAARITLESRGMAGQLADLHKGAASGAVWKGMIDGVSALLGLSSLSGMVMLLALPKRRRIGMVLAAIGTVAAVVGWVVWVPH